LTQRLIESPLMSSDCGKWSHDLKGNWLVWLRLDAGHRAKSAGGDEV
jgi:hypothetical protein